jgi:predicted anti-sigma-YlaC factor YlaD
MTTSNELSCQELVELVTEYLEGTLPAQERVRFEDHLAICPGCSNYLDQMRRTIQMVGALKEEAIPDDAKEQLLRAFRAWKQTA